MYHPPFPAFVLALRRFYASACAKPGHRNGAADLRQFANPHATHGAKDAQFLTGKDTLGWKRGEDEYNPSKPRNHSLFFKPASGICNTRNNLCVLALFSCVIMLLCQFGHVSQTVTYPSDHISYFNKPSPHNVSHSKRRPKSHEPAQGYSKQTHHNDTLPTIDVPDSLRFTNKTTLNFFHLHKTGGTSIKTTLQNYYSGKVKANGDKVIIEELCYARPDGGSTRGGATFHRWRCDWERLEASSTDDRNRRDIVQGHQFLSRGISTVITRRDIRTFSVFRHPFERKISFFFHFFVRAVGRNSSSVSWEELRDFLVHNRVHIDANLGRDAGPNYIAGRLLSDGTSGFVGDYARGYYDVPAGRADAVVHAAVAKLRTFVFVGIQSEPYATFCLLRKTARAFDAAHGVVHDGAPPRIDHSVGRLNSGPDRPAAPDVWARLTAAEKRAFERSEIVDLRIYREAVRLFRLQVAAFACRDERALNVSGGYETAARR